MNSIYDIVLSGLQAKALVDTISKIKEETDSWDEFSKDLIIRLNSYTAHCEVIEYRNTKWE